MHLSPRRGAVRASVRFWNGVRTLSIVRSGRRWCAKEQQHESAMHPRIPLSRCGGRGPAHTQLSNIRGNPDGHRARIRPVSPPWAPPLRLVAATDPLGPPTYSRSRSCVRACDPARAPSAERRTLPSRGPCSLAAGSENYATPRKVPTRLRRPSSRRSRFTSTCRREAIPTGSLNSMEFGASGGRAFIHGPRQPSTRTAGGLSGRVLGESGSPGGKV